MNECKLQDFVVVNFGFPIKDPIHYKYGYSVHDPHTGDKKEAWEHRSGDAVKGKGWIIVRSFKFSF